MSIFKAAFTKKPKIGTHSGTFHCDEILAVFLLQSLPEFQSHEVLRTRDLELLDQCDIVVDVGSVFDPARKRFDHHQSSFNESLSTLRPDVGNHKTKLRLIINVIFCFN